MDAQAAEALAAVHSARHDQVASAGDRAAERDVASPLALVLDDQHLAAQRADDFAALVAYSEHFLQDRCATDHRRRHLIAGTALEEHAVDERRFVTRHGAANRHWQRVGAGYGHRLRLRHDHGLVFGTGEQDGIGVRQVGQERQVARDAFEQRAVLGRQVPDGGQRGVRGRLGRLDG